MSRIEQLPKMWQRPGMYLFDYRRSDGASMFAEFIHATYYLSGRNRPKKVRFQSHREMYGCVAEGYEMTRDGMGTHIPLELEKHSSPIDWLSNQAITLGANSPLQASIGIANLISFTESCVLDMTSGNEHFRQVFYLGKPVSPCSRRQKNELSTTTPYLSLWFTLHPTVFQSRTIGAKTFAEALERLKRYISVDFQVTKKKRSDGFEMTVEMAQKAAERAERLKPYPEPVLVPAMAS